MTVDGLLLAGDHAAKAAHKAEHADTHGGSRDSQTVANLAVGVAGEAEVDELAVGVGKGGEEGGEGEVVVDGGLLAPFVRLAQNEEIAALAAVVLIEDGADTPGDPAALLPRSAVGPQGTSIAPEGLRGLLHEVGGGTAVVVLVAQAQLPDDAPLALEEGEEELSLRVLFSDGHTPA